MQELEDDLRSLGTAEPIAESIMKNLQAWRAAAPAPPVPVDESIRTLVEEQLCLGWQAAFEGRFAIGWAAAQERFYRRKGAKVYHNGKRWLSLLIKKLFEISWDLWSHRNNELHKRESGIHLRDLHRKVAEEFRRGANRLPRLRLLMQPGQVSVQRCPVASIEAWLHQVQTERALHLQTTPEETMRQRQSNFMRSRFCVSQLQTISEQGA